MAGRQRGQLCWSQLRTRFSARTVIRLFCLMARPRLPGLVARPGLRRREEGRGAPQHGTGSRGVSSRSLGFAGTGLGRGNVGPCAAVRARRADRGPRQQPSQGGEQGAVCQSGFGTATWRPSTAISWRSIKISASFAAVERARRTSHANTRLGRRWRRRTNTSHEHAGANRAERAKPQTSACEATLNRFGHLGSAKYTWTLVAKVNAREPSRSPRWPAAGASTPSVSTCPRR